MVINTNFRYIKYVRMYPINQLLRNRIEHLSGKYKALYEVKVKSLAKREW